MTAIRNRIFAMGVLLWLPACGWSAEAADPCAQFTGNVERERALFAGAAQALGAGAEVALAPAMTPGRLYQLTLLPQAQVHFAVPPEKQRPAPDPHAGLVSLSLEHAGRYRIALDQPVWVDVINSGVAVKSADFQGQKGCSAPHKIVEFSLPAHAPLLLQFSAGGEHVRVSITAAAAP
jgi:hypothetical protein